MPTRGLVLVVEDEEPLRVMLGSLLRTNGFRVVLTGTSHDALRICGRLTRPINLLITDIQLPKLSGFDLAALLAIERPAMPVLFISGAFTEQDLEIQMRITPGRDFLAKPFAPEAFAKKVKRMLAVPQEAGDVEEPANRGLSLLEPVETRTAQSETGMYCPALRTIDNWHPTCSRALRMRRFRRQRAKPA